MKKQFVYDNKRVKKGLQSIAKVDFEGWAYWQDPKITEEEGQVIMDSLQALDTWNWQK